MKTDAGGLCDCDSQIHSVGDPTPWEWMGVMSIYKAHGQMAGMH